MEIKQLRYVIESLIFTSDTPLNMRQMMGILPDVEKKEIEQALELLENDLDERAFFLNKVGGGYQFATKPEFSKWIRQLHESKSRNRMTRASLETLAIVAFKQPISRIEVSAIRGVNSDGVIKNLLERKLITITGRDQEQGRALLFATTKEFLQYFNLNSIADLPRPKEIEELLAAGEGGKILQELPDEVFNDPDEEETDGKKNNAEKENSSEKENNGKKEKNGQDEKKSGPKADEKSMPVNKEQAVESDDTAK